MAGKIPFHHMTLRAFVHPTEIPEKVALCMLYLEDPDRSFSATENDIKDYMESLEINLNETYFGARLIIFEKKISKSAQIRKFFINVLRASGEYYVDSVLEEKVDDDCNLHLRFNKDRILRAIEDKNLDGFSISEDENIIKATLKIASYPSKREIAIKTIKKFIDENTKKEKES